MSKTVTGCEIESSVGGYAEGPQQLLRKAFRIIRRNYGCPGPDGLSLKVVRQNFAHYAEQLEYELSRKTFVFSEPRPVAIETGKLTPVNRSVYIYNVLDRWVQCYLRLLLEKYVEPSLSDSVYSYVRGRTRLQGLKTLIQDNPNFVLLLDIQNFFDSISQELLFRKLLDMNVPPCLIKMVREAISHSMDGLPRGNSLSPILANLYLMSIDALFPEKYVRFSDDMLFSIRLADDAIQVSSIVKEHLGLLGLSIPDRKTRLYFRPTEIDIIPEYPWFRAESIYIPTN